MVEFHSQEQQRSGNTVVITILNQRRICTMIARFYKADIPLEGQYVPGEYTATVNGFERPFRTQ